LGQRRSVRKLLHRVIAKAFGFSDGIDFVFAIAGSININSKSDSNSIARPGNNKRIRNTNGIAGLGNTNSDGKLSWAASQTHSVITALEIQDPDNFTGLTSFARGSMAL
jgi:hypothetical protein